MLFGLIHENRVEPPKSDSSELRFVMITPTAGAAGGIRIYP
jgi:hypothetical protein